MRKPTFEVYGFAQVDLIQDFQRVRPDWNATLRPTRIPTVEGLYGANGESILSARQTRLGVRGSLPAGEYDLFARIEFDFFGLGEGQAGRRRTEHAPAAPGLRLVGPGARRPHRQPLHGRRLLAHHHRLLGPGRDGLLPERPDPLHALHRRAHLRGRPGAARHRPGSHRRLAGSRRPTTLAPRSLLPDLTAQYRLTQGWGYLQLSGILRWLGYDTPGAAVQTKGDAIGWGLHASSQVKLIPDKLKLLVAVVGGHGNLLLHERRHARPRLRRARWPPRSAEAVPLLGITAYLDVYLEQALLQRDRLQHHR